MSSRRNTVRKSKNIVILGATGGSVDILDTINDVNSALPEPRYKCVGFLDDNKDLWGKEVLGAEVLGPFSSAVEYLPQCHFVTGIGSPYNFWKKEDIISGLGLPLDKFETIVHPTASVSATAKLGSGCVIYQHVTVTSNVQIGNHVLILPNTIISHDDIIEDYSIVTGGVCIAGDVRVGKSCYVGTNSAVKQHITIGNYCLIGMGSVVNRNVPDNSVVVGNPAKFLRHTR